MPPLSALGQVMSASSNMVRVELDSDCRHTTFSTPENPSRAPAAPPRTQLLCSMRSLLKKLNQNVLVGDRVRVGSIDWGSGKGQVEEVLPRSSELTDPAVANVDLVLLVFALANPPFEEAQATRFLVSAEASGLPLRLVLNKADLVSEAELQRRVEQVQSWGYEPLVVSCGGSGRGLGPVLQALRGKTGVVAGPSGAGKSSLINAIRLGRHRADEGDAGDGAGRPAVEAYGAPPLTIPRDALQPDAAGTGGGNGQDSSTAAPASASASEPAEVASRGGIIGSGQAAGGDTGVFLAVGDLTRLGRGKHTTTAVTLIKLPDGGRLADTPGFSQPSLDGVSSTELALYFPEFQARAEAHGPCQFNNCQHMLEPGCVVNSADPPLERHMIYAKFLLEIKEREETDVKVLQAGKRAREGSAKLKSGRGGRLRTEAKLDTSKHRRSSRTRAKQLVRDLWDNM